nr:MAG TPA: hypothetical protein [Caudoviricetes sp.]
MVLNSVVSPHTHATPKDHTKDHTHAHTQDIIHQ